MASVKHATTKAAGQRVYAIADWNAEHVLNLSEFVPYTGATADVDLGSKNFITTGTGTFGSTYQAVLGDDANSRAGYFTNGSNVLYLADGTYAINAFGDVVLHDTYVIDDYFGVKSIDTNNRMLYDALGTQIMLDWSGTAQPAFPTRPLLLPNIVTFVNDTDTGIVWTSSGVMKFLSNNNYVAYFTTTDAFIANQELDVFYNAAGKSVDFKTYITGVGYVSMLRLGRGADGNNYGKAWIGAGRAGVDYQLIFDGESSDGTITYMEDEAYFGIDKPIVLPYLGAAPANLANGMIWMESDGLHIYYNDAEKIVAGV